MSPERTLNLIVLALVAVILVLIILIILGEIPSPFKPKETSPQPPPRGYPANKGGFL